MDLEKETEKNGGERRFRLNGGAFKINQYKNPLPFFFSLFPTGLVLEV